MTEQSLRELVKEVLSKPEYSISDALQVRNDYFAIRRTDKNALSYHKSILEVE